MATTTGSEYDHIDISDGTDVVRHYLKDTVARNDIIISQTQPSESGNKLWIEDEAEVEHTVPTYAEFEALNDSHTMQIARINAMSPTATKLTVQSFSGEKSFGSAGKAKYYNGKLKVYGTLSAVRYLLPLNDPVDGITSSGAFRQTLPRGTYYIECNLSGYIPETRKCCIRYTTGTFANYTEIESGTVITTESPIMLALSIPAQSYGTEEDALIVDFVVYDLNDKLISKNEFSDYINRKQYRRYELIERIQNSNGRPGAISSLTVIDGYLYVFQYQEENVSSSGTIYKINEDGTLIDTGNNFTSNIGHQNTVDYCEGNHTLVASRYGENVFNMYLIPNVDSTTNAFDVTDSDTITIDLSSENSIGHGALNVIWGQDDNLKYDMVYVMTFDTDKTTQYISLVQLGKGSNNFGSGTMISGQGDNEFNGTYQILKTLTRTLTTVNGIVDRNNDACYCDGKIYELPAPTSTSGLPLMIHSFKDFGTTLETEKLLIEYRAANGTALNQEKEGIAIYKDRMYVGTHAAGLYVYGF